jgi:hypothetical protein
MTLVVSINLIPQLLGVQLLLVDREAGLSISIIYSGGFFCSPIATIPPIAVILPAMCRMVITNGGCYRFARTGIGLKARVVVVVVASMLLVQLATADCPRYPIAPDALVALGKLLRLRRKPSLPMYPRSSVSARRLWSW